MSTATIIAAADPTRHSIGRLCELLEANYDDVRVAIELAGVTPSLVLDRVEYFDAASFEAIGAAHERRKAKGGDRGQ